MDLLKMMVIEKKPTFAFSVENKLFGREKSKECWWMQNVYNFYGNSSSITNENNDSESSWNSQPHIKFRNQYYW